MTHHLDLNLEVLLLEVPEELERILILIHLLFFVIRKTDIA